MPSKEFMELLNLVDLWSKHDKEYIWESALKDDAPEYVRAALEDLKKQVAQNEAEGIEI